MMYLIMIILLIFGQAFGDDTIRFDRDEVTVNAGEFANIIAIINIDKRVEISVDGLPEDVGRIIIYPKHGISQFNSTITIATYDDAPSGVYKVRVDFKGEEMIESREITVIVNNSREENVKTFYFDINLEPQVVEIINGEKIEYKIFVEPIEGEVEEVRLEVLENEKIEIIELNQSSFIPPFNATLTAQVTNAKVGDVLELIIVGESENAYDSINSIIKIKKPEESTLNKDVTLLSLLSIIPILAYIFKKGWIKINIRSV